MSESNGEIKSLRVAVAIFAFGLASTSSSGDPLEVQRGVFESRVVLTGELAAENAVQLVVPNANIWPVQVRWLAEDGVDVAAGETIVEFDNSQLAGNLEQLEQASLEAQNRLASLRAEARSLEVEALLEVAQKKAQLEIAQIDAAVPEGLLAQQEYEERQVTLRRSELELEQADRALELLRVASEARIRKQRVELQKARTAEAEAREGIELLTLRAPRDGVLLVSENRWEGRPFKTGDASRPGSTIATIPELSSMIVEAWLYDVDDGEIQPGAPVSVTVDAFPEEEWTGSVTKIGTVASEVSFRSLRRAFRVVVRLDDLDVEKMRPGMSVKVVLRRRQEDVLNIPRSALRWSDSEGRLQAEALTAGSRWLPIEVGGCNAQECVLLSGLAEGTELRALSLGEPSP